MNQFALFASPWWVNLLFLIPVGLFFYFRKNRLKITKSQLVSTAVFGIAFGFVEAAAVIYLRAALGFLAGYGGTLKDVALQSEAYQQVWAAAALPQSLLTVEMFREVSTIVMLASVSALAAKKTRERLALLLWIRRKRGYMVLSVSSVTGSVPVGWRCRGDWQRKALLQG